jgi:succinyl-diaminopimelate desuccinylase
MSANGVSNLYAHIGQSLPSFCFAGHIDVVPAGNIEDWIFHPFKGEVVGDLLYGRGVVDMKGSIGSFLSALEDFIPFFKKGSISLILTSDEEGMALHGTRFVVDQLKKENVAFDAILVGEPTNPYILGEMIKIGRRGSLNVHGTIKGKGGHVAYPKDACNPIPLVLPFLSHILSVQWDDGCEGFDPSTLQITSLYTDSFATNVIPSEVSFSFNIRFNPKHTLGSLTSKIYEIFYYHGLEGNLDIKLSAEPFISSSTTAFLNIVQSCVKDLTKKQPMLSTSGGTSDARFLKDLGPVIEFGLISEQAHKVNEHVKIQDLIDLKTIYFGILESLFLKEAHVL